MSQFGVEQPSSPQPQGSSCGHRNPGKGRTEAAAGPDNAPAHRRPRPAATSAGQERGLTADEARGLENLLLLLLLAAQVSKRVDDDPEDEVQHDDDDDEEEQQVVDHSGWEQRLLRGGAERLGPGVPRPPGRQGSGGGRAAIEGPSPQQKEDGRSGLNSRLRKEASRDKAPENELDYEAGPVPAPNFW